MTNNEFSMLSAQLERLEQGQRDIIARLDKMTSVDRDLAERVARLEAKQERYITFKMLVMAGGAATGAGGVLGHLATRFLG